MFANRSSSTFILTRIVFLRALGFVYFIAFLVAFHQNDALIGDNGMTPARFVLEQAKVRAAEKRKRREAWLVDMASTTSNFNDRVRNRQFAKIRSLLFDASIKLRQSKMYQRMREVLWDRANRMGQPLITVLWMARDASRLNPWLNGIALTGMFLSAFICIVGSANVPILLVLWICQRSLMSVGNVWYGYGWEVQLAELGFHALFAVPLLSLDPIWAGPSRIVMWTLRWHLFRIMMGAGLIKFRSGDRKWKDLTTMYYFYETQPVPSVLTRTMHFLPKIWHKMEVLINHFVECVAPFLLILPGSPRSLVRFGGLIQMQFQSTLICTGNLSFLNWLTMVPAIFCLDDGFWRRFFAPSRVVEASIVAVTSVPSLSRSIVTSLFGGLVFWLSIPVVKNLFSKRQQMNASYDPLRLINTYGAFGVVNEEREEWIIQSASDDNSANEDWREYEFKVKPGNIMTHPRWITPYHYRLDWQMWIAASGRSLDRSPWFYPFLYKLLEGDKTTRQLLALDPWEGEGKQAKQIRIDAYRYKFHREKERIGNGKGAPYWDREFVRRVYPREGTATLKSLKGEIQSVWPDRII